MFKVDTASESYALKFYPQQAADQRDRLGAEFSSLVFLWSNGIRCIPEPVLASSESDCALYQWLNGNPVTEGTKVDIEDSADYLKSIQKLTSQKEAADLRVASASCFSVSQILEQLNERLERLDREVENYSQLDSFLRDEFRPSLERETDTVRSALKASGIDMHTKLRPDQKTLSPSDFGLHNSLRSPDGKLYFIDFEYFGWDDPVKMVADAILHPGASLQPELQKYFHQLMNSYFSALDRDFSIRFRLSLPLYALIWCLIQLGEFLPERWARRELAGQDSHIQIAQERQLAKARNLLQTLDGSHHSGGLIAALGLEN